MNSLYMEQQYQSQDWSGVTMHLLDSILEKLEKTKDALQFGVVCQSWHGVLKDNQRNRIQMNNEIPMLLVPDKDDRHSWHAYDVGNKLILDLSLSVPYGKRFCGSSRGWLAAVNADWSVTLHKPFSNHGPTVRLPPMFPPNPEDIDLNLYPGSIDFAEYHDYHVNKVFITADPLVNPDKCFIAAILSEFGHVAFIRLVDAENGDWTLLKRSIAQDIMHCGTQLYCVDCAGDVESLDLKDYPNNTPTFKFVTNVDDLRRFGVKRYLVQSYDGSKVYLLRRYSEYEVEKDYDDDDDDEDDENDDNDNDESGGGENDNDDGNVIENSGGSGVSIDLGSRYTTTFEVLELNLDTGKTIEVNSIRDNAIFLGDNSSVCVKASSFVGCQPNCIYFTHDMDSIGGFGLAPVISDVGAYDVKTKEFKFDSLLDSHTLQSMTRRCPIWVVPTFDEYLYSGS